MPFAEKNKKGIEKDETCDRKNRKKDKKGKRKAKG
jgi:hypothetical protein